MPGMEQELLTPETRACRKVAAKAAKELRGRINERVEMVGTIEGQRKRLTCAILLRHWDEDMKKPSRLSKALAHCPIEAERITKLYRVALAACDALVAKWDAGLSGLTPLRTEAHAMVSKLAECMEELSQSFEANYRTFSPQGVGIRKEPKYELPTRGVSGLFTRMENIIDNNKGHFNAKEVLADMPASVRPSVEAIRLWRASQRRAVRRAIGKAGGKPGKPGRPKKGKPPPEVD